MGMEEIVNVSVTVDTKTVSQKGFGTLLILAQHSFWTDLVKEFPTESLLDSLTSAEVPSYHPLYKMAESIARQDPHVDTVKVAKSGSTVLTTFGMAPADGLVEGDTVSFKVHTSDVHDYTHTVGGEEDRAATAAALAALLEAQGFDCTVTGYGIAIENPNLALIPVFSDLKNVEVYNSTPDLGYSDTLGEIVLVDDDFYGVAVANNSAANLAAVTEWTASRAKVFFGHFAGPSSLYLDFLSVFPTGVHRTYIQYTESDNDGLYPGLEAGAYILSQAPGSATLAFKQLPGVPVSNIPADVRAAIKAAYGNTYRSVGGLDIIQDGFAVSGRFLDLTIAIDWLTARARERVYAWIASKKKVPYTDKSVSQAVAEVQAVLDLATLPGTDVLRDTPAPRAWGPKVADVSANDRANRLLPDIKFSGELAGAIQGVRVNGTLSL